MTQQMQHSIASTLQEHANNAAKQARISTLMSGLQRAKAKYDNSVSVLDPWVFSPSLVVQRAWIV